MISWFSAWEVVVGGAAMGPTSPHNSQEITTACLLPGRRGWQEMLSGSFQDALVLSHASAGIYHPIKERCGHPAVTLKWPQDHAAAWAICREVGRRSPCNGSQTYHDARERCGIEERGKTSTVRKSHSCTHCIESWDFLKSCFVSQCQYLHN